YADLVGALFRMHPPGTPTGTLLVTDAKNPSTTEVPRSWSHADEWYEWIDQPQDNPALSMLVYVDEGSYGHAPGRHAISWCHEFEGGRAFYTALGHPEACFADENFRKHLAGGIAW